MSLSAQSGNGAIITAMRRFPPPWTIDEANNACFIVRDATGQALGYFYFDQWVWACGVTLFPTSI